MFDGILIELFWAPGSLNPVHHTEVLGEKSETSSHDGTLADHSAILLDANNILKPDNGETASLKQRSGEAVFGKQLYLALLARFSSLDHLITGLAANTCRVRKVLREDAAI